MKTAKFFMAMISCLIIALLSSCKTQQQNNLSSIPFTEADRYFVRNDVKGRVPAKITKQSEFDSYFGQAAVMGAQPTPIDFSKQFVIAVDMDDTNLTTTLSPKSLRKTDRQLVFSYTAKQGGAQSFTTHPLLLIIVDKKYEADVTLKQE